MKPKKVIVLLVVLILLIIAIAFFLNLIRFNVNSYNSLEVSDSKTVTFKKLAIEKVQYVTPGLINNITISNQDLDNLDSLYGEAGVCLTDNKGVFLKFAFDQDGLLTNMVNSGRGEFLEFKKGSSQAQILSLANILMKDRSGVVVRNCIADHYWVSPEKATESDFMFILKYDKWSFHVKGSHSTVDLIFKKNLLDKIVYNYRFFESM